MNALSRERGGIIPIPAGWKTSTELGEFWGISQYEACRKLKKMIPLGWYESRKYGVQTSNGVRMIPHYRMTSKCPLAKGAK